MLYAIKKKSTNSYVYGYSCWYIPRFYGSKRASASDRRSSYSPNISDARTIEKLSSAKRHLTTIRNYYCGENKEEALDHVIVEVILTEGKEIDN